jgi:hypothetical protein
MFTVICSQSKLRFIEISLENNSRHWGLIHHFGKYSSTWIAWSWEEIWANDRISQLGIEVNSYNLFGEFHCNRVLYLTVERWVVLFSRVDQFLTELSKRWVVLFPLFFRDCYCYFCWFDCLIDLLYTSSYWCDIYELTTRSKFIFSIHKKLISINLFN